MRWVIVISDIMIPCVMISVITYGLLKGINVYEAFIEGAKEGLQIVMQILPTLIGLMLAVGMLRQSGALEGLSKIIQPLISWTGFPVEVVPMTCMRMVSSSATIGLVMDLFKNYGPDSFIGRLSSVMMGCTETVFYTLSVYFMTVGIKKTRYAVSGAILVNIAGVIAAFYITLQVFGR